MCVLFNIDLVAAREPDFVHTPPGMKTPLRLHQLWALFWVISSAPDRHVATPLLADDMGLGKTATAIGVAVVAPHLVQLWEDVRDYPDRHLDADDDRTECPSGTYRSGMQCPCVPGSWSRKIAVELSCGPTLVAATHEILEGWKREFAKFVDPESGIVMQSLYKGPAFNRRDVLAHGRIRAAAGGQDENVRLTPRPGQSRYILLMPTTDAAKGIEDEFCAVVPRRNGKPATKVKFAIQPSRVIVDEAHLIKNKKTKFWTRIRRWLRRSIQPTYLLGLSGTPMTRDPGDFGRFIDHIMEPGAGWSKPLRPPDGCTPKRLKQLVVRYNRSLAQGAKTPAGRVPGGQQQQPQDDFSAELASMLSHFTLRRVRGTLFAGQRLGGGTPPVEYEVIDCRPPASHHAHVQAVIATTKGEVQRRLHDRLEIWRAQPEGNRPSKPTMQDILKHVSSGTASNSNFETLEICATFPAVARLLHDKRYVKWKFNGSDVKKIITKGTVDEARGSEIWRRCRNICSGSTKMEKLGELIGRMIDDEEPARGSGGLVPDKKMIVLAPKPFAAHVACAYIDQEFPNVGVSIVVSNVPPARRSALYGPFQTATVDELRQEHETPGPATPRILVTTLGIGAQGLNLARANYLVVLGPSWAESTHDQAFCRIDRDGQLFTPHLFMLLDSTNPAESLIRQRQLRRVTLETGVWEATS